MTEGRAYNPGMPSYDHTQRGGWHWVMLVFALVLVDAAVVTGVWPLLLPALAALLAAGAFAQLRVWDDGDALSARLGPLPLFGARVPYADIQSVEVTRTRCTTARYGWPGAWLVLNLWGYDAVALHLKQPRGLLRYRRCLIGTDEPEALAAI